MYIKIMKKYLLLVFLIVNITLIKCYADTAYSLKLDLVIGGSEEKNYLIGEVAGITVDQGDNVYIIDSACKSIRVFNSTGTYLRQIGCEGTGPGEFSDYNFLQMALSPKGDLYVMDRKISRISRFSAKGEYLYSFRIPFYPFRSRYLLMDRQETLIVTGLLANSDRMFHLFSNKGKLIKSYGYMLPVAKTADRSVFKEYNKLARLGGIALDNKTGDVLVLSSMEYKIWRFSGLSDSPTLFIQHQANYFRPFFFLDVAGRKVRIFPSKRLFLYQKLLYLGMWTHPEPEEYKMDLFFNNKYQATKEVRGFLHHVDRQGRLYFAEEDRVARYCLVKDVNQRID
jgi:hypothetical protein